MNNKTFKFATTMFAFVCAVVLSLAIGKQAYAGYFVNANGTDQSSGVSIQTFSDGTAYVTGSNGVGGSVVLDYVVYKNIRYRVVGIMDSAFYGNKQVTKVTLGDEVVFIGSNAFAEAKKLTEVKLSKNLLSIGDTAFYKCKSLKSINIPTSVESIGIQAFKGCKAMEDVTLNFNIQKDLKFGEKCFWNLKKNSVITIKNLVGDTDYGKAYMKQLKLYANKSKIKASK